MKRYLYSAKSCLRKARHMATGDLRTRLTYWLRDAEDENTRTDWDRLADTLRIIAQPISRSLITKNTKRRRVLVAQLERAADAMQGVVL